jgi:hypothetical protein
VPQFLKALHHVLVGRRKKPMELFRHRDRIANDGLRHDEPAVRFDGFANQGPELSEVVRVRQRWLLLHDEAV